VGFDAAPALSPSEDHLRYLVRRGRVRAVRAGAGETAVEAWYGVPWGDAPGGVLVLADAVLEPVDEEVPDGLPSELLRFTTTSPPPSPRIASGGPERTRRPR
jgi:hypothetical protein